MLDNEEILFSNKYSSQQTVRLIFKIRKEPQLRYRRQIIKRISEESNFNKLCLYDLKTFLPLILLRQDKMGMSAIIETRMPFLDIELLKMALTMPDAEKISNTNWKIILKEIANDLLPQEIIKREKCGFGLPISMWLKNQATRMPQKPSSFIEKIICDADLYHLGTVKYKKLSLLLKKEREILQ